MPRIQMPRIRTIKPEFFTDEDIARLQPLYRLAFQGLWCYADKAGRLEERPLRLKVQILPFDDVNFEAVLDALVAARFVQRYHGPDGRAYLQIRSFLKHQRPRNDEPESELPHVQALTENSDESVTAQCLGKERKGKELERSTSRTSSAQAVVDLWNQLVTAPIPQVTKLTADRQAKIDARLKIFPDLAVWRTAISWANGQDWMRAPGTGKHPHWTVTLDWLCVNDGQLQRCLERAAAEQSTSVVAPEWVCNHVQLCSSRSICANATFLGRPLKVKVLAS